MVLDYVISGLLILGMTGGYITFRKANIWANERQVQSNNLDEKLGIIATLFDEGLDLFHSYADASGGGIDLSHTPTDFKQILTDLIMNKLNPVDNYATEEKEWTLSKEENDTPTQETEV